VLSIFDDFISAVLWIICKNCLIPFNILLDFDVSEELR